MVKFRDLQDDRAALDLGKEVERLRLEVQLAHQGYLVPLEAAEGQAKLP
jgi:hypothetical protein